MRWTIPNILTVGRILAAPGVALCYVLFDRPMADWIALILFVGAALTDFFDGWLARKLNQITDIGKMLDPIADKAMVLIALAVLVAMVPPPHYARWFELEYLRDWMLVPIALIFLREIMVSGLREYLGDVKLPVTNLAKWKTTVQMVAICAVIFSFAIFFSGAEPIFQAHGEYVDISTIADAGGGIHSLAKITFPASLALLYVAAILTLITGWDYFRKGLAYIRMREES